jgi:hypothetical protein
MYITADDIKSNLAKGFTLTEYLEEADLEIIDVAEKLGVRGIEEIMNPVHYKVKRLAVVFINMRLAQDKYGTNSPDTSNEKYRDLYEMYKIELKEIRNEITYEMITGNVNSMAGRVGVFELYRT